MKNVCYFAKYFDSDKYVSTKEYKSPFVCARDTYKEIGNHTIYVYQRNVVTGDTHLVLTNSDSYFFCTFTGVLEDDCTLKSVMLICPKSSSKAKIYERLYYPNGIIRNKSRYINN